MKTVILTAATGQGHMTAARNLQAAFAAGRPDASVKVLDVSALNPVLKRMAGWYNFFLRRPPYWMNAFYRFVHLTRLEKTGAAFTRTWAARMFREERPDLLVSVHPMLNYGAARASAGVRSAVKLAVVLTDPFPPFWRGWAEPRADLTVAPTAAAASQLAAWGLRPEKIAVCGMPVSRGLREPGGTQRLQDLRDRLNFSPRRFTLLINAGTAGRPAAERLYRLLVSNEFLAPKIQVLFVAGSNPEMKARIEKLKPPFPVAVFGWHEDIPALLEISHAVFTKPGALSVYEALLKGVPVLLDTCAGSMPQERGLADWIEREGLGWKINRPEEAAGILQKTAVREGLEKRARTPAVLGDAGGIAGCILQRLVPGQTPHPRLPEALKPCQTTT